MESGLGRRSIISFQPKRETYEIENDAKKALKNEELFYNFLDFLAEEFMKIFNQIEFNAEYQLQEKTYLEVFYSYHLKIQSKINEDENSLISKEIASRELKVIKLSCLYACLNHTKELVINPVDMEQAIDTIEMLATDFKKFLNYKPKYADKYDKLFNFFVENEGKEFTKTQLINQHYCEFSTSRDKARFYFDEYIEVLREIATEKGYYLLEENINRNSGRAYTLKRFTNEESKIDLKEIDKIIKNTNDYEIGYDDFEYNL